MIGQGVGPRTGDIFVLKAADPVELGFIHPVEQGLEFRLGLAGVADDEGRPQGDVRAGGAPGRDFVQCAGGGGGAGHAAQRFGMGVLERDVEIGQDQPVGHQRHQIAHMRIGVDVMQPHPGPQPAQFARKVSDMGADLAVFPGAGVMLAVQAVGRGILADHQQFLHPRLDQLFRLAQHGMGGAALQAAAHIGDDAEPAPVIAAFGNLQIAVMARGQGDGRGRQQVDEGIGGGRHGGVDGIQHLFVLMRAGDGQDAGMRAGDVFGVRPQAAGDDHPAILAQRLAYGIQAFGLGAVKETAGVHDHRIGALIIGADRIAFGAQAGQDAFRVHQRLGAAQADHADGGLARPPVIGDDGTGVARDARGDDVGATAGRVLRHGARYSGKAGRGEGGLVPQWAGRRGKRYQGVAGVG